MFFNKSTYLAVVCLLSLVACGGGGSSSDANDSTNNSAPTVTPPETNSPSDTPDSTKGNTRISQTSIVMNDLEGNELSTSVMTAIYDAQGRLSGEFLEAFTDGTPTITVMTAYRFNSQGQRIELVAETDNLVDDVDDILSVNTQQWQYSSQGLERIVSNTRYGAAYNLGDDNGVTEYQYSNGRLVRSIGTSVSSQGIESTQDRTLNYNNNGQLSGSKYTYTFDLTGYTEHLYGDAGQLVESTMVQVSDGRINKSVSRYIPQDTGYVIQLDLYLDDELMQMGTITTTYESGTCVNAKVTDGVAAFGLGEGFPFQDIRCINR